MKLIAALLLLAAPPFASTNQAQESSRTLPYQIPPFHADTCQKTGLESLKGQTGTMVGRVISARMEQDKMLPNDQADRALLMPWQDELGGTGLNGLIPELACTLRWWADCNVLQLPDRMRDGKRRDTMLLAAVQRYPTVGKVQEYMLENAYAMQEFTDSDYSPENLSRYAVGCHAVALDIDIWNQKKKVFRQRMLIHTAVPDGAVVFSIWGQKGSGRLKAVSLRDGGKRPSSAPVDVRECYQLEVSGPVELTNYLAMKELRFVLDDWSMGHVTVMTPWIREASVPAGR